jgi:hypothetical protein
MGVPVLRVPQPYGVHRAERQQPVLVDRPSSPTATWTVEEYSVGDLLSVRPYRGSFEPVSVVPTSARE